MGVNMAAELVCRSDSEGTHRKGQEGQGEGPEQESCEGYGWKVLLCHNFLLE